MNKNIIFPVLLGFLYWAKKGNNMKISQKGIELIKNSEGFLPKPYKDIAGKLTIGYGHLIKPGEKFTEITKEQAEKILIQDIKAAENTVNKLVKIPLTQNQFDALVSFVFNLGSNALKNSTLLKKLNSLDITGAANEFERWIYFTGDNGQKFKSAGLQNRRYNEKLLFQETV